MDIAYQSAIDIKSRARLELEVSEWMIPAGSAVRSHLLALSALERLSQCQCSLTLFLSRISSVLRRAQKLDLSPAS